MTNNQKFARFPRAAFVGFDHIFNELEEMTKHATDHYPPHNIIKDEDMKYRIGDLVIPQLWLHLTSWRRRISVGFLLSQI